MTEIERKRAAAIARVVVYYSAGCSWEKATTEERIRAEDVTLGYVLPMLKEHRREVRRARGKTVGYVEVVVSALDRKPRPVVTDGHDEVQIEKSMAFDPDRLVARVVLVPAKRKRGAK